MAYFTETELLERFEYYTLQLEERLLEGEDFQTICDTIPTVAHLSHAETHEIVYVNKKHTELMGYTLDEVQENWSDFVEKHIHPSTVSFCIAAFPQLYATNNSCQTMAFIQHVRVNADTDYTPIITFTKAANLPDERALWIVLLPKDYGKLSKQMEQIIRMDEFKLKHFRRFQQLTGREIEVLRLLANGRNNPQIAEELFLSRSTVETHRKNLKRKLELGSFRDLMRYAFAFNLVEI